MPSAVLVSMSNIQAGRKFAEINHEKLDKLKAEIDPLKERAKLAEEQNKLLDEQLAEAEGERNELKTRMTAMLQESQGLEEAGRRLESFVERLEAEKSGMRDQLAAMAKQLVAAQQAYSALQDERGKIAIELAVAQAEKEGAVSLSSADRDRMLADQARLESNAASHKEHIRVKEATIETLKKERDELQRVLAVAEADAQWKDERIARAISEREEQRNQKEAVQQQLAAMEVNHKRAEEERAEEREAEQSKRAALEARLAATVTEHEQLEERSTNAEAQVSKLLAEVSLLQARGSSAEARYANEVAARTAKADETARMAEQLAALQAESHGKDHLLGKLEQQVEEQFNEVKMLLARADAAEARVVALQQTSEAANAERTAAAEQLALTTADRLHQEREDVRRDMDKQLAERKAEFAERAAFAEARCKELSALRDESQASVTVLYEQMVASREERSDLQQSLALAKSEKLTESDRADRAEARIAEASQQREAALTERNRMAGEVKLIEGEKKALEDVNARLEARIAELQAEQVQLEAKVVAALAKVEDMVQQRDSVTEAKLSAEAKILSLHEQKSELQQQLVEANVNERSAGIRIAAMEQTISSLKDDKQTFLTQLEAAESQEADMLRQRDVAVAEGARTKEEMAILQATYAKALEREKELSETIDKLRESKANSQGVAMALEATLKASESACEAKVAEADKRALRAMEERSVQAEECARLKEAAAAAAAELSGKEALIQKLELQVDAKAERQRAAEHLAQERTERAMLEEMVRKTEHRLEDYKTELVARAEFAETRVAQITGLRDESESSMIAVKAQLRASEEARAKLEQSLAAKEAEKRAAEELRQAAETKASQTMSERDAMLAERDRASEATKAALAEKAAVLAVSSQLEWQVATLRAEHGKMEEFLKESSQIQVAMARANVQVKDESHLAATTGRLRTGVYCGGTGYGMEPSAATTTPASRRLSGGLSPELGARHQMTYGL